MKLKNSRIQTLIIYSILSAIALVMLFPLLWLISTALKSPTENIWQSPPQLLPSQPTLENFSKVWQFGELVLTDLEKLYGQKPR